MPHPTRAPAARPRRLLPVPLLLLLAACHPGAQQPVFPDRLKPAEGEFSVMTYNVRRYCYDDRDGDGQADDPKPPAEVQALVDVLATFRPDVLALQEMGSPTLFADFQARLKAAGLDFPYADHLAAPQTNVNLAVLSRFPIVGRASVTNETYTIGDSVLPVQRGFQVVDLQVNERYQFRLVNVHLKSKVFSISGQTEMRRNEARLLNKQVRRFLTDNPEMNLAVVGDFNDQRTSAAMREAMGRELEDVRPRDEFGDIWTHFWEAEETYARIDYIMLNSGMSMELLPPKTRAIRHPAAVNASDHRPLLAVFLARER
jgi:endonuclease/exonuclease/phosphatase family metal-dependent hydrolase